MKILVTKDGKVFKDNTLLKPRLFKGYLRVKINGSTHLVLIVYFMNTILVNPGQSLKRNLGFPIHL